MRHEALRLSRRRGWVREKKGTGHCGGPDLTKGSASIESSHDRNENGAIVHDFLAIT